MKCSNCAGNLVHKTDYVDFNSKVLGRVIIPNIKIDKCSSCDEILLSAHESKKVLQFVQKEEQKAIANLPISDFLSAKEAAEIIGITKQAFSKNPKIKNGLILSAKVGGRKLFLRKSVELFKQKDNGKFLLKPSTQVRKEFIDELTSNAETQMEWAVQQLETMLKIHLVKKKADWESESLEHFTPKSSTIFLIGKPKTVSKVVESSNVDFATSREIIPPAWMIPNHPR